MGLGAPSKMLPTQIHTAYDSSIFNLDQSSNYAPSNQSYVAVYNKS